MQFICFYILLFKANLCLNGDVEVAEGVVIDIFRLVFHMAEVLGLTLGQLSQHSILSCSLVGILD